MKRRNFITGILGTIGAAIAVPLASANYIKPLKPKGMLGYSDKRIPTWDEINRFAEKLGFKNSVSLEDSIYYNGKEISEDLIVFLSFRRHNDCTGRSLITAYVTKKRKVPHIKWPFTYKEIESKCYFIDSVDWKKEFGKIITEMLEI